MTKYHDRDLEEMYDEMLNECGQEDGGMVKCCGYEFEPADVLRTMDPVAYRCGKNDYIDGLVKDEVLHEHSDGSFHDEPEEDEDEDDDEDCNEFDGNDTEYYND